MNTATYETVEYERKGKPPLTIRQRLMAGRLVSICITTPCAHCHGRLMLDAYERRIGCINCGREG